MRIDEMILKANDNGKTCINYDDNITYSQKKGFVIPHGKDGDFVCTDGWLEKPARHLTVEEAEKELDCVIDALDISDLFRSPKEPPESIRNVIILPHKYCDNSFFAGYYSYKSNTWYTPPGVVIKEPLYWIDPEDIRKLLPKQE